MKISRTASMASEEAIQALCQAEKIQKEYELQCVISLIGQRLRLRRRPLNLRFAQSLCAAQKLSNGPMTQATSFSLTPSGCGAVPWPGFR
jgi:hypothetical protein